MWRSLKFRLFAAAAVCIAGALVVYWVVLSQVFESHVSQRLYKELEAHLNQLTTRLEVTATGTVQLTEEPDNPSFDRPLSGLYWQVRTAGGDVHASRSLWDQTIEPPASTGQPGEISRHRDVESNSGTLLMVTRNIVLKSGGRDHAVNLVVAMDQKELAAARASFASDVAVLVLLLAVFLFVAMVGQTLIGLSPLATLRQRLTEVAAKRAEKLEGAFPTEVDALVAELNGLLAERGEMVERARAGAADLAHGLKTPLAILAAEARALERAGRSAEAQEITRQIGLMHRHVERQLARARARGQHRLLGEGTDMSEAIGKLVGAFMQLPGGESIAWRQDIPDDLTAAIDPMDFEELAGNILDNARKWTSGEVSVVARRAGDMIECTIADNGPGVEASQRANILRRGGRADQETPGAGLGLAISQDLAEIYGGRITLGDAEGGGLKVTATLPAAAAPNA